MRWPVAILVAVGALAAQDGAALRGPYEDPAHAEVPFGSVSFYRMPWRGYVDTWPATRLLDAVGVVVSRPELVSKLAPLLAEHGIRHQRIEWGWGTVEWDETGFSTADQQAAQIAALKSAGIRPLILLNAHAADPGPSRSRTVRVLAPARAGDRSLQLPPGTEVVLHRTGLQGQRRALGAFPLITALAEDGTATLSAPLAQDVPVGNVRLTTWRYRPFTGAVHADGTANPDGMETCRGWVTYARLAMSRARALLGSNDFDVEVWNELSFGSEFLESKHFYDPPLVFREPVRYEAHGKKAKGPEIILPMTIDLAAREFPGVGVTSGFASQRPWDQGERAWPGQVAISKHYYAGIRTEPLSPDHPQFGQRAALIDATGSACPPLTFIPTTGVSFPELNFTSFKTEDLCRDLQPWRRSGDRASLGWHGRFSHPGTGQPVALWQTEFNFSTVGITAWMARQAPGAESDPGLSALRHAIRAKALLRSVFFQISKGVERLYLFSADARTDDLRLLPGSTLEQLAQGIDDGLDLGVQLPPLRRALDLLRPLARPIATPRRLTVEGIVEHQPVRVWAGDGTPGGPDLHHRDVTAILPFQLDDRRFAVGVYVMTLDLLQVRDAARPVLDPARYDLPEAPFTITLGNLAASGLTATLVDPRSDTRQSIPVEDAGGGQVRLRLPLTDGLRILLLEEAEAGPLLDQPRVTDEAVEFTPQSPGSAVVTWGPLPERTASGTAGPISLTAGVPVRVALPRRPAGSGVAIRVTTGGRTLRWPFWLDDLQGTDITVGAVSQVAEPSLLPELTGPVATAWDWTADAGHPWHIKADGGTAEVPGGVATVRFSAARPADLLPSTSTIDQVTIIPTVMQGAAAWTVHVVLDASAHPGERDLHRFWILWPVGSGTLVVDLRAATVADFHRLRLHPAIATPPLRFSVP